jgi:hypothetical protein
MFSTNLRSLLSPYQVFARRVGSRQVRSRRRRWSGSCTFTTQSSVMVPKATRISHRGAECSGSQIQPGSSLLRLKSSGFWGAQHRLVNQKPNTAWEFLSYVCVAPSAPPDPGSCKRGCLRNASERPGSGGAAMDSLWEKKKIQKRSRCLNLRADRQGCWLTRFDAKLRLTLLRALSFCY